MSDPQKKKRLRKRAEKAERRKLEKAIEQGGRHDREKKRNRKK